MTDREKPTDGVFVRLTSNIRRRDALKAMAATAALAGLADACVAPDSAPAAGSSSAGPVPAGGAYAAGKGPRGTPSDPFIIGAKVTWEKKLTPPELTTLAALCDTIIPADEKSPSASKLGAPDYINEYVSSPGRDNPLAQVRGGIIWINNESTARFGKPYHQLSNADRTAICDDICYVPNAKPGYVAGAMFFDRVRDLTATAFYTTAEGWKDIGYIGNVALPAYPPVPAEILQRLGLTAQA
jgi:gluconate 2-dehydrogenase gamma chain